MRVAFHCTAAMEAGRKIGMAMLILLAAAGCGTNMAYTSLAPEAAADLQAGGPVLLLLPIDVQLSEVTAAGLLEPRADWTTAASFHMEGSLEAFFDARDLELESYEPPRGDPLALRDNDQLIKLHEQVGAAIMLHLYLTEHALPTKKKKLNWSLGPDAVRLGGNRIADYGLFIYVRDSYTTAGRAVMMGVAAAFGVGLVGGIQVGFASLVDLKTGDVVWFHRLARGTGDLRTAEPAAETITELLKGFPA